MQMLKQLAEYPDAIALAQRTLLHLQSDQQQAKETLAVMELEIEKIILEDPTLTNDSKRRAARKQLQQINLDYCTASNRAIELARKVDEQKIQLDFLTNSFRVALLEMRMSIANLEASNPR